MKLLLDEMYSPEIAEQLRALGHDAVSAQERPELKSAPDPDIFRLTQLEQRVIVTNNHRHFAPLANAALQPGEAFHGIVFTADRTLPPNKRTIPVMVDLLDDLLNRQRAVDKLSTGIEWLLPKPSGRGR